VTAHRERSEPTRRLGAEQRAPAGPGGAAGPADLSAVCQEAIALLSALDRPALRLRLRSGAASVDLEWPPPLAAGGGPAAPMGAAAAAKPGPEPAREPVAHVTAGLVGTFHRGPEPGAAPFVEVGDVVQVGQQVGVVEAMKLLTAVESETAGLITEVLVADAAPVEYGQPLLAIRLSEAS
jgi:acetyl-CoA carboxylase biotin carboxyl carrier protein